MEIPKFIRQILLRRYRAWLVTKRWDPSVPILRWAVRRNVPGIAVAVGTLHEFMSGNAISDGRGFAAVEHLVEISNSSGYYICVRGWLFDFYEPIARLSVSIDRDAAPVPVFSLDRPDIHHLFPGEANAARSGFWACIPKFNLGMPAYTVALEARTATGKLLRFSFDSVKISCQYAPPVS